MGKLSVILYITLAVVLLLFIFHSPTKPSHNHHRRHRRLILLSNFSFSSPAAPDHRIPFDPIVADIERKREDKQWEKTHFLDHHHEAALAMESQPEWENFMDGEDYLNDQDKFNVTGRLVLLFPRIDIEPEDGYLSEHEITDWNLKQTRKEVLYRTQREMELHDKNHDGFVSFEEYQPPVWVRNSDNNSFGHEMGWWKEEHFNASDTDVNGLLNLTEFNDFQHPADSKNPRLLHWLCKEEVRERDTDKDGKVNFKEFFRGLFDLVRNYDEESRNFSHESNDSFESPARNLFAQLDKDGDGYLSDVELLPVIGKLHPSEHYYAKQQAEYIISQADIDKDGRLTLSEMIESPYVFYSTILNEEDDDDYEYQDEFR